MIEIVNHTWVLSGIHIYTYLFYIAYFWLSFITTMILLIKYRFVIALYLKARKFMRVFK